jgi:hypothetical protein
MVADSAKAASCLATGTADNSEGQGMSADRTPLAPHAFCALPLVRRAYIALVTALAVFIGALIVLREPFRGYLAEVHIAGPPTPGLDLADATKWLKQTDPRIAVVATPAGEISPRTLIRMTYVAPLPSPATARLDDLAARWLYQYLPDRLQSYRRAALAELRAAASAAHQREDAANERVELLRQQQISQLLARSGQPPADTATSNAPPVAPAAAPPPAPVPTMPVDRSKALAQLDELRAEFARLLASQTDEHPQVVTLRSQIAALERQLGMAPVEEPAAAPSRTESMTLPDAGHSSNDPASDAQSRFISTTAIPRDGANLPDESELTASLKAALEELSAAGRQCQATEQLLSERMQELSSRNSAAEWSTSPATVITRLGGTPRRLVLAIGGLLASVVGVFMFRASAAAVAPRRIETTGELASVLELPVVADVLSLRSTAPSHRRRWLSPPRVGAIVRLAEVVIAVAVAACVISIAVEPSLSSQVVADPFGTLSEVIGRFRGGDR